MTMQDYLIRVTEKATSELFAAYLRLPEDKRDWAPSTKARSAHAQVVECAQLNADTDHLLKHRAWVKGKDEYETEKQRLLSLSLDDLKAALEANAAIAIEAIRATPSDAMTDVVPMPWGEETIGDICGFPYWNMTYHTAQINEIAMMLDIDV